MKKTKFNVVCTNVDHLEAGKYIASFVPADEVNVDKLKDGFRVAAFTEEVDLGEEQEEVFVVGEVYEMRISKAVTKAEPTDEENEKIAEAKAKKAETDKAYKAKKKAEEIELLKNATKNA
jgi:hypothetical protein